MTLCCTLVDHSGSIYTWIERCKLGRTYNITWRPQRSFDLPPIPLLTSLTWRPRFSLQFLSFNHINRPNFHSLHSHAFFHLTHVFACLLKRPIYLKLSSQKDKEYVQSDDFGPQTQDLLCASKSLSKMSIFRYPVLDLNHT